MFAKLVLPGLAAILFVITPAAIAADIDVEAKVREYFSGTPLIEIARCESKFTQFDSSGAALRGGMGGKMVGVFQIYDDVHAEFANSLGMNIETLEGNLAYAKYLFDREGTTPWLSSSHCWNGTHDSLSMNLSLGIVHPQVALLQKILNTNGFAVASDGPGSPGNETEKFGSLTREAVQKFQCAKGIACDGDESSTGYGFVGPRTRAALLSGTSVSVVSADYTPEQQAEIARLQAQIVELTQLLNTLLNA